MQINGKNRFKYSQMVAIYSFPPSVSSGWNKICDFNIISFLGRRTVSLSIKTLIYSKYTSRSSSMRLFNQSTNIIQQVIFLGLEEILLPCLCSLDLEFKYLWFHLQPQ